MAIVRVPAWPLMPMMQALLAMAAPDPCLARQWTLFGGSIGFARARGAAARGTAGRLGAMRTAPHGPRRPYPRTGKR